MSVGLGARSAVHRLANRAGLLTAIASLGLTAVAAAIERASAGAGAVDRALATVFGLVLPIAGFALVGLLTGKRRLEDASWSSARFGADRRLVTFGQVATTAAFMAVLAAGAAVLAVVVAHAPGSPPLLADAATSAWIAALTGAAYVAWFSFGASFFRFGGGRVVALGLDFFLGGTGLLAWVAPRGLAQNLLGLVTSDLSQRGASVLLAGFGLLAALVASARSGR